MIFARTLLIFFCIPFCLDGQSGFNISKEEEAKVYSNAISEYIKAVNKTHPLTFDTLFVGPDEYLFDVILPSEQQGKKIHLLKGEGAGDRKMEYKKSFVYVNIIGSISKSDAQIIFITFIAEKQNGNPEWIPQHNFIIDYKYDPKTEQYKLEKQRFDMQYLKRE